ncbi:hypothetical protein HDU67_009987 [Dinochytrium kinnereticum]|nr:hypothetical protein HDU67_009987 [Dinochytrium kinnereticum]
MTERWVSTKKYWCDYCKMFVVDNKIGRLNHETGTKHKDRVQQYLRTLHRNEQIKEREAQKTSMLLKAIEKSAGTQYAKDMAAQLNLETKSTIKPKPMESPKYSFYNGSTGSATSQSRPKRPLDEVPEVKKVIVPTTGLGEWEVVVEKTTAYERKTDHDKGDDPGQRGTGSDGEGPQRPRQQQWQDTEGEENLSGFQLREKGLEVGLLEGGQSAEAAPLFKKRKRKQQ